MSVKLSATARTAMADAIVTAVGTSAVIKIYTGAQPANVAAAATGTVLAQLTGNASQFGTTASGVLTVSAITQDSSADNTGTAGWVRVFKSDGTTAVIDGTVTATGGGGELELTTTSIVTGQPVSISSLSFTMPGA